MAGSREQTRVSREIFGRRVAGYRVQATFYRAVFGRHIGYFTRADYSLQSRFWSEWAISREQTTVSRTVLENCVPKSREQSAVYRVVFGRRVAGCRVQTKVYRAVFGRPVACYFVQTTVSEKFWFSVWPVLASRQQSTEQFLV